jgi:hypothetical protein
MSLAGWEPDCPGNECPHLLGDKSRRGVAGCGPRRPRRWRARRIGARRQHLWIPIGGQLSGLLRVGDIADWFITS